MISMFKEYFSDYCERLSNVNTVGIYFELGLVLGIQVTKHT